MERHRIIERPDVEEILQAERETYEFIGQVVN